MTGLRAERGAGLVGAIFLLVVVALLIAGMLRFTLVQRRTDALGWQGARAYQAGRAGLEWAGYQALELANCVGSYGDFTLNGFIISSGCSTSSHTEKSSVIIRYRLEVTAQRGSYGEPDYVSRRLRGVVSESPP